ncbi:MULTISPECIES: flavodoxin family protein [unclassified Roseovarius]|uniref:flavodoxin family protein n=1 Tax=unclassified Roseovarius TaxID=2614913 RepID=UPI00273FC3F3|nr:MULTISPECIES: flavodoxin family protein [unclassified Roseovarius]
MEKAMVKIAIVYHSGYGHTAVQAEAVRRGASEVSGTDVSLIPVENRDESWDFIDSADAIIFGSPTYFGSASAQLKELLDETSGRWLEGRWANKLAAGFTNSAGMSGDKLATLQQINHFAMQHGMIWIGLGLPPGNNTSTGSPDDLNRLGGFLGAMSQADADVPPEVAPAGSDLRTAEFLGRRVAEAAVRWRAGQAAETVAA